MVVKVYPKEIQSFSNFTVQKNELMGIWLRTNMAASILMRQSQPLEQVETLDSKFFYPLSFTFDEMKLNTLKSVPCFLTGYTSTYLTVNGRLSAAALITILIVKVAAFISITDKNTVHLSIY